MDFSEISCISLRFQNCGTEDVFLRRRTGRLTFAFGFVTLFAFIVAILTILMNLFLPPVPVTTTTQKKVETRISLLVGFFAIFLLLLLCAIRIMSMFVEKIGTRTIEIIAVCVSTLMPAIIVPSDWYFMAKLSGFDPGHTYDSFCFSDKQLLLVFVSISAGMHNVVPIRWYLLVIQECATIVTYAAVVLLADYPYGKQDGMYSFVLLTFLVGSTSFGTRQMELQERKSLLIYLDEKQRRFQTEYQLSLVEKTSVKQFCSSSQEEVSSLPSTTLTGRMLSDTNQSIVDFLGTLSNIGTAEQWLIEPTEVRVNIDSFLGEGGYGFVLSGSFHGTPVAVKLPKNAVFEKASQFQILSFCSEIRIMRRLRHSNLVAFYGAIMDVENGGLALVMEFVPGIILNEFVGADNGCLAERNDRCRILVDLCCALRYLHSRKTRIVHGDLKPSNIKVEFLKGGVRAKILDFGLSRKLTRNSKPLGGTTRWMAPEILRRARPDTAADVFSFGRVAFFTATSVKPLERLSDKALKSLSKRGQVPVLAWPNDCPLGNQLMAIVQQCTQHEVISRPKMTDVHASICLVADLPVPVSKKLDDADRRVLRCLQTMFQGRLETCEQGEAAGPLAHDHVPDSSSLSPSGPLAQVPEDEIVMQMEPCVQAPESQPKSITSEAPILEAPRFQLTPTSSRLGFLLLLLKSCNIEVDSSKCCSFHNAVDTLRRLVTGLDIVKCNRDFFDDVIGQCSNCGLMAMSEPGPDALCPFCDRAASDCEGEPSVSDCKGVENPQTIKL